MKCRRCGRRLGSYEGASDPDPFSLMGGLELNNDRWPSLDVPKGFGIRGPRTGAGLYLESFEGRSYLRMRCKCGRNEKVRPWKIPRPEGAEELYL